MKRTLTPCPFASPRGFSLAVTAWRRLLLAGLTVPATMAAGAAEYTILHELGGNGPRNPRGDLVRASDGNYYGTSTFGGVPGNGTVFRMTPTGVLTTLVEFTHHAPGNKGRFPYGNLVEHTDGMLYGMTTYGGADDRGTLFKMTKHGVLTTLVEFTGGAGSQPGIGPTDTLIKAADGNFYGTAFGGGGGAGTIFRMSPSGSFTTVHVFRGGPDSRDPTAPAAGLLEFPAGTFYGTTTRGGPFGIFSGFGTVFRLDGGGVEVLVEFSENETANRGATPYGRLIRGADGYLYGTTWEGGAFDNGTVFKMTVAGALTTLVDFTGNGATNKGDRPYAGLVEGADRNFYGTTFYGGGSGLGTVFQMTPAGVLTTLVEFTGTSGPHTGAGPYGGLMRDTDGSFLGMTYGGGAEDAGTIFRLRAGTNLESWRRQYFGTNSNDGNAADSADPDGDGIINYLEFATGGDPSTASSLPVSLRLAGNNLEFTWPRAKAALADGIVFAVEWSDTLTAGSWRTNGITDSVIADDGSLQTVRSTRGIGSAGRRFMRLRVAPG